MLGAAAAVLTLAAAAVRWGGRAGRAGGDGKDRVYDRMAVAPNAAAGRGHGWGRGRGLGRPGDSQSYQSVAALDADADTDLDFAERDGAPDARPVPAPPRAGRAALAPAAGPTTTGLYQVDEEPSPSPHRALP